MPRTACGARTRAGLLRRRRRRGGQGAADARPRCRYDTQDLSVTEVLPQQVALSECFIQIYERKAADAPP